MEPTIFTTLAELLQSSGMTEWATYLLRNVPGLPPIAQTFHLMAISAVMGSIVLVDLRVLGLALRSQPLPELVARVMPWMWYALPVHLVSGLIFIVARPMRYFVNPVFGFKFAFMLPALALAFVFQMALSRDRTFWDRTGGRRTLAAAIALVSLFCWIGVVFAGRFIAYADYIFTPE
jgi:hypothetical protein